MLTDIFFIRHGDPQRDPRIDYRTLPGPDLSERGRGEARQAGAFLADKRLDHLYVSPFARTTQTAEQIVTLLDLPVTFSSLVTEYATHEPWEQLEQRTGEFIGTLLESSHERVGVVSHGSPIKALLVHLTNGQVDLSIYSDIHKNPAPPAGIWHVSRTSSADVWQAGFVFRP